MENKKRQGRLREPESTKQHFVRIVLQYLEQQIPKKNDFTMNLFFFFISLGFIDSFWF